MAFREMPVSNESPAYDMQVELEGNVYGFTFQWNTRGAFWSMSVFDSTGTPLVQGVAIRLGVDLLKRFKNPALPKGSFIAWDTSGTHTEPDFDTFGDRVVLMYVDSAAA